MEHVLRSTDLFSTGILCQGEGATMFASMTVVTNQAGVIHSFQPTRCGTPLLMRTLGPLSCLQPTIVECNSQCYVNYGTSWNACTKWRNTASKNCLNFLPLMGSVQAQIIWKKFGRVPDTRVNRTKRRSIFAAAKGQEKNISQDKEESNPAGVLRRILATPGVHQGPACYDALSARLVEQAGFSFTFMSGFAVSASRLGAPDVGLLSYGEILDQGRLITAAVSIPVIGDGDNGYGNALNVKRTVKGFIQAGFAGILIEDQVSPKSCGHFGRKKVVSREEAFTRIKAAIDARSESESDIVIIARSDARQAESLEEALFRTQIFAQLGADVLFIDALASKDEMLAFCKVAPETPKMANMLEGGGRTPILSPLELEKLGFKIVAYPLSLIGVSMRAMQDALRALKSGRLPPPANLPGFDEIKEIVGISGYYEEDERYASFQFPASLRGASAGVEEKPVLPQDPEDSDVELNSPVLEGNIIGDGSDIIALPGPEDPEYVDPEILDEKDANTTFSNALQGIWSRVLRLKITGISGDVKLDVRIPAGFMEGLAATIPDVAGLNLPTLLNDALSKVKGDLRSGEQLMDFRDRNGQRIQIFLE